MKTGIKNINCWRRVINVILPANKRKQGSNIENKASANCNSEYCLMENSFLFLNFHLLPTTNPPMNKEKNKAEAIYRLPKYIWYISINATSREAEVKPPIYNPVTQGCHIRTLYDKNGCTVNTLNIYISQNRWENEYATLEDSWEKEDSTFKMEFNVEMKDAPKCSRCEGECVLGTSLIVSGSFVFLGALSSAAIAIKSY